MSLSIDDLLNALSNPETPSLDSDKKETWRRIQAGDGFEELGLPKSELDEFLNNWIAENPYTNL